MVCKLDRRVAEWRVVEGEVVGLHLDREEYFTVNPSAAVLWPLLADGATEPELGSRLVHAFGLSESAARADVTAFLADLRARGLLVEDDG
jgi:hypothetical protein